MTQPKFRIPVAKPLLRLVAVFMVAQVMQVFLLLVIAVELFGG